VDADGNYSVAGVDVSSLTDGDLTIDAQATDNNGDTVTAQDTATLDTTAPTAPGVTIADGDAFITADEIDTNGNVAVSIDLVGTNAEADDTLTVNGAELTLTQVQIDAGTVETTVSAPAEGEELTVAATITDAAGNTSNEGRASAEVQPAGKLDVGGGDNGVITGGDGNDVLIGDLGGKITIVDPASNYNISLLVDTSGSMGSDSGESGLSLMELTKQALKNLANQLQEHEGVINVQLVSFSTHASTPLVLEGLGSSNVDQLLGAIDDLEPDGGTNYQAAFEQSVNWFNAQNNQADTQEFESLTYFLTDGDPTFDYRTDNGNESGPGNATSYTVLQNSVNAFQTLGAVSQVEAIGVGAGATEQYLRFFTTTGDDVDTNSVYVQGFGDYGWVDGDYDYYNWGAGTVTAQAGDVDIVNNADDLAAALEGGSELEELVESEQDIVQGGAGNDIIYGDVINTDHLEWTNQSTGVEFNQGSHDGMGYEGLVQYLKWGINDGDEPDSEQVIEYVRENWESLIDLTRNEGPGNTIDGQEGDDIAIGGAGNDELVGGAGNDILTGGLGADVFRWEFGNQGTESMPAEDVVQDFSEGTYTGSGEADQLDLADLLQGETEENIADYLSVTQEADGLVFQVSHDGAAGGETQTIRLKGKSFSDFQASNADELIQNMIDNGQLNIDS